MVSHCPNFRVAVINKKMVVRSSYLRVQARPWILTPGSFHPKYKNKTNKTQTKYGKLTSNVLLYSSSNLLSKR